MYSFNFLLNLEWNHTSAYFTNLSIFSHGITPIVRSNWNFALNIPTETRNRFWIRTKPSSTLSGLRILRRKVKLENATSTTVRDEQNRGVCEASRNWLKRSMNIRSIPGYCPCVLLCVITASLVSIIAINYGGRWTALCWLGRSVFYRSSITRCRAVLMLCYKPA